jgi:hypothetical protein
MKNKTRNRLRKKSRVWLRLIRNHIFKDSLHRRPIAEVCDRIIKYTPEIKKLIEYQEEDYRRMCSHYGWLYEPDNRTGEETYRYKSIEQVNFQLSYISDRFNAPFRLRWLLGVPDKIAGLPEKLEDEEE